MEYLILLIFLGIGYFFGSRKEARHYASIEKRERETLQQPVVTLGKHVPSGKVRECRLVTGGTVISIDYFKRIVASLRNLVGGNVSSYESLVDRARREAILKMKERAKTADTIINVRIETSTIGKSANKKGQVGSVEALAYGTAIYFAQESVE